MPQAKRRDHQAQHFQGRIGNRVDRVRCHQGRSPGPPFAGEHLHPVKDQADDEGYKKQQEREIDKSENNSHDLFNISMSFCGYQGVLPMCSVYFSTDARQVSPAWHHHAARKVSFG